MGKRKNPGLTIALYVLAGILVLYVIWGIIYCNNYIKTAITAGQLTVTGKEFEIVNFYMQNTALYALFAIALFTLGFMLKKNTTRTDEYFTPGYNSAAAGPSALDDATDNDTDEI